MVQGTHTLRALSGAANYIFRCRNSINQSTRRKSSSVRIPQDSSGLVRTSCSLNQLDSVNCGVIVSIVNDGASSEDRATTVRLASRLRESGGKEGVYYIVRFPSRWRLYAFPWDDFGDLWHGDVWRRFVVDDLAEAWTGHATVTAEQLRPWWKGSPRGRVERSGIRAYTVFHGDDFAETQITPVRIESAFELGNSKITWSVDPHEQQNADHTLALRQLLGF